MATDKLELYNLALFNFGHTKRVVSLTEDSAERRNCQSIYESRKKALLGMAKWGFAKAEVILSPTTTTPTGWSYEYYYPQKCIRVIEIARQSVATKRIPFQTAIIFDNDTGTEERVIWTDEPEARMIHIRDISNTTLFTPNFDLALSYLMSVDLARVMARDSKLTSEMSETFKFHYQQAIISGEAEAVDEDAQDPDWITDR